MEKPYSLRLYPLSSPSYSPRWPQWWLHWVNPLVYLETLKYLFQRATRGYADCDTWSLDGYLAYVVYQGVQHLRKHKQGVPTRYMPPTPTPSDEDILKASAEFDKDLDVILDGMEAYQQLSWDIGTEHCYTGKSPEEIQKEEAKVQEYREKGLELFISPDRFNPELYELWRAPLQSKFETGMKMLTLLFQNLWD